MTLNSVKFHTPENQIYIEPYKEFDTITTTNGQLGGDLISDEGLPISQVYNQENQHNELIQQNLSLLEDCKELKEVCSILSNELDRQKLGYKKLRGKYKIIKENN